MTIAERREDAAIRTDRPESADVLPTVRDILRLDVMISGAPEVLVGDDALDARVRWVHASDSAGIGRLLDGGELVLTTASGWPSEPDQLRALVESLADVGAAGVVIELGTHYRWVPGIVVETARERGIALVALAREVKFVAVTEAVHRRIMADQTAALRARDEVRERFTALALRGSPADFVVRQLGHTLASPVVLENLAHEVVAADMSPALEQEVLDSWERRSRAVHREHGLLVAAGSAPRGEDWLVVPVEARGLRWGHLVALPGPRHPAGRMAVMEQAAIALALGRLADGATDEWARIGHRLLLDGLLSGRFASASSAESRLAAAGLPVTGQRLHGVVIAGSAVTADGVAAAARALGGRALLGSPPPGVAQPAATILLSLPPDAALGAAEARAFGYAAATSPATAVLSIGTAATGVEAALVSLQEAIDLARSPGGAGGRGPVARLSADRPLMRLVTTLRDDHRLLDLGERMLAPLVEHDLDRQGDLLDVLGAMLSHPSNRTAAAQSSHLSRSVFYQRLALIEDLLGVDLDDGETQTALHLALMVRRSAAR